MEDEQINQETVIETVSESVLKEFRDFLFNTASAFLDVEQESFELFFKRDKSNSIIKQFLLNSQTNYLILNLENDGDFQIVVDLETLTSGEALLIFKRLEFAFDPEVKPKDLFRQNLHLMNIGEVDSDFDPVQLAHICIKNGLNPILKNLATVPESPAVGPASNMLLSKVSKEKDFLNNVQRKFDDLDFLLLQNNAMNDVPEVKLVYDPAIVLACSEAARKGQTPTLEDISEDLLKSDLFISALTELVNKWGHLTSILLKHSTENEFESLSAEIEYWMKYQQALYAVQEQFKRPEVNLTLEILRQKKKFHKKNDLAQELNLNQKIAQVDSIVSIMKDIPVDKLAAARDLAEISQAVINIFGQIKRLFGNHDYPAQKCMKLLENFSQDLTNKLIGYFTNMNIMAMPFKDFEELNNNLKKHIIHIWTVQTNLMKDFFNQNSGNDSNKVTTFVYKMKHAKFHDRIKNLFLHRETHESIKNIINEIYNKEDQMQERIKSLEFIKEDEIQKVFDSVFDINIYDLTPAGERALEISKKRYDEKIDSVEKEIIMKIRDLLGSAKSYNEMYTVFSRFSGLMKRPQVKAAIQEYQEQLLKKIQDNSNDLLAKYKRRFENTGNKDIARYYGISNISGSYIWVEQIFSHFSTNRDEVEAVLGDKLKNTTKGQDFEKFYENFRKMKESEGVNEKLDKTDFQFTGKLLAIETATRGNSLKLIVNFSAETQNMIEEIRNMIKQKNYFKTNMTKKYYFKKNAWPVYVNALKLTETVKIWNYLIPKIDEKMTPLLANQLKKVYRAIEKGMRLEWSSKEHIDDEQVKYFLNFSEVVHTLEDASEYLYEKMAKIDEKVKILNTCENEFSAFDKEIKDIQEIIDDLLLKEFTNIEFLVNETNSKIERVFIRRLVETLSLWIEEFSKFKYESKSKIKNKLIKFFTTHEITVKNMKINIEPPLQEARTKWLDNLHQQINLYTSQKKLQVNRYNVFNQSPDQKAPGSRDFSDLLQKISYSVLSNAYRILHEKLNHAEVYVRKWLSYQALWDININVFYEQFGEDLNTWQIVLNEIKQGRNTFDNSEFNVNYGPIVIDYKNVQMKINNIYDSLHKEILNEFGKKFSAKVGSIYDSIHENKNKIEKLNFSGSGDLVENISIMNFCKDHIEIWEQELEKANENEKLLIQQKYHFGENYKNVAQIAKDFNRFKQNYLYKNSQFETNIESMKNSLLSEEESVMKKVAEVENIWNNKKPFSSEMHPNEALEVLSTLEKAIFDNQKTLEKLNMAKNLLNLPPLDFELMNVIIEDSTMLRELWGCIKKIWDPIDSIYETPFTEANPPAYNKLFDTTSEALQELPAKFKNHSIVVGKRKELQTIRKKNRIIADLKTDAIKENHIKEIFKRIKIQKPITDVLIRDFYNMNLDANEKAIMEVVALAQGELVLESMLRKIKDFWLNENFQTSKYQNKCMLIKGWDDVMSRTEEDIGQLTSMKLSQHFKTFESEIKTWHDKILNVSSVLGVWMDVQRKWVYLEGIFNGSSDIKQQLGSEYDRFQNTDREFMNIMKQMATKLKIIEVIATIPNLLKTLEFLSETLDKIQKSLSEYLESQRQAFSRFYFVGDDDLLEIIGNSKDVANIQKYFAKMFAGINTIETEEKGDMLVAMASKENERVRFDKPIKLSNYERINLWLTEIEKQMQNSLGTQLDNCISQWKDCSPANLRTLVEKFPTQTILLGLQTYWTFIVEDYILGKKNLLEVEKRLIGYLSQMAEEVLMNLEVLTRKRYEQLITELVHKRDVTRKLGGFHELDVKAFKWMYYMRFYIDMTDKNLATKLKVRMGNSEFTYGHEYLGITDKLVQTPLTDKCYFTLTQALWMRMGGAPFGPAGTGKTESVKALGNNLGRFVLVFNCDETFNFKAMGRIFIGLCQVGAWGCFDEFNRLEERILSAVSQQILAIQTGLRENNLKILLMERNVNLNPNMGIFVTMNPGYAGRSNLPENLKQLFRQMAMIKPDSILIAQVMLFSQGFKSAEELSGKVVSLFELCFDQLSSQPHYDFGLRSLKSVLNSAGALKRKAMIETKVDNPHTLDFEQQIILRSFCDTVVPKLISDDSPLLKSLIKGVFPTSNVPPIEDAQLMIHIRDECEKRFLLHSNEKFIEKILQLNQIMKLVHGIMLVGPTGCGKSAAWRTLLAALTKLDGVKGESYIIDPKAINKDELYGKLDNTTMEWTDGIFTYILRRICENQRGESSKRHWIIFDGDVDPEWAENLNSVLDDNKLLTLPNGERLSIPPNVKIMFEVESLKYATLATVSRCGMVWFSEDILEDSDIFQHYLMRLREDNYDSLVKISAAHETVNEAKVVRGYCVDAITELFVQPNGKSVAAIALEVAAKQPHVMEFSRIRVLEALFALIRKGVSKVVEMDEQKFGNYASDRARLDKFMMNWTLFAINWSFVGDLKLYERSEYFNTLRSSVFELPNGLSWPTTDSATTLIDYEVKIDDGEFSLWKAKVPSLDIPAEKVTNADTIIPTVDTLRHQEVLCSWLLEHRPFIICGPPGSGKTMTLMSTLKNLQDFEMIFVNFSSSTDPHLILKQFEHYCEYVKAVSGVTLRPRQPNKWLVVFCDEINLPDEDKYGTQVVITFLRQLTEQHGFWRISDKQWVSLERIQFVGACNPPTDAGRHPLSQRFLRHCPLILVDFPGYDSLVQIYGTFNRAMLKRVPSLKPYADSLTSAMVEYYSQSQRRFTADQQAHYIYSPRELTRWKYALNEALDNIGSLEELVRLWAHEALRLFEDRLVYDEEKKWCQEKVDEISMRFFPGIDSSALVRPIIFSTYITKSYQSAKLEDLRDFIIAKLKVFNEEEYDVQLVIFDEVVDHIIKIDRVLRQPIGHMLLVGASGVGKTTLSRFVSWINGLKVFQIKAGRNYSLANFDEDLRDVMKRAGCRMEKITFIFDESNVLSVAFMERMNALLASGEIPGLFDGEEYFSLINAYKEAQGGNKARETDDEIYQQFIKNVQKNLHVVFTMNPSSPDFTNRAASSPAIFNRCVIDWFGDWSDAALFQVAKEMTEGLNFGTGIEHGVIVELIVRVHKSICKLNEKLRASAKKFNFMTPRDFLDFIKHFRNLLDEKRHELTEQQDHLQKGLQSLKNTETNVNELKVSLFKYDQDLEIKNNEANKKLDLIMEKQRQSNLKIEDSVKLSAQIDKKKEEIAASEEMVQRDLDAVGPALERAKKSVSSISSAALNEMKNYKQPPEKVKMTLEAVLLLMKGKKFEWADIKNEMTKGDFITNVVNFQINKVSDAVRNKVKADYINKAEAWNLEKIYSSSKAAGPLAEWLESQLKYSEILTQVKPLTDKIEELAKGRIELEDQQAQLTAIIAELEEGIKQSKIEHAELITITSKLKLEKETVQKKLSKAESLLNGLSSEKIRWEKSSKEFVNQFKTLTGDVFLASAFLAYLGFFDQFYRQQLIKVWRDYLKASKIEFKQDLSFIEYLSIPSERIIWQSKGLPADDICIQNAIILKRFNRYPLIIDPSGQAIDFMINFFNEEITEGDKKVEKKLIRTSFIDDGFMKQLETALRFGLPILIQDVEKIEPILNSVLNKEIIKQGGRNLIRVGDQEIDFAREFKLFMITRNADARFTPDLCSRVTFVNFTVTKASLENQFLNIYLRSERPDVEKNRINLLKLQGEYTVQLRMLEDELLTELSKSEGGNILDNEEMIQKLENLKTQSTEIEKEKEQSEINLEINNQVTEQYRNVASVSSKLFFALQVMSNVNIMYQISLKFYMKIIYQLLQTNSKLQAIPATEYEHRIETIMEQIFSRIFEKIYGSIMEKDKYLFALKFVQIFLEKNYSKEINEMFSYIYMPNKLIESTLPTNFLGGLLQKSELLKLEDLSSKPMFEHLIDNMKTKADTWKHIIQDKTVRSIENFSFIDFTKIENSHPKDPKAIMIAKKIAEVLLFNILKPEITFAKLRELIDVVFGKEFLESWSLNLKESVEVDAEAKSPVLFASAPGFDPSGKIYELAKSLGKKYDDVAIGSAEGFEIAHRAIEHATKNGGWVILKNVHLAPSWLKELEQDLYRMTPNPNFRLFLLAEFSDKIPVTLLRQSVKFIFELPDGVKSSVRRTYQLLYTSAKSDKAPHERCRLHFLLAWIHAVIMERLRYTPTGWSKRYEFSEADQKCALDVIDEYIDLQGQRQNLPVDSIPFEALQSVITENIYGGKIDNMYDLKILNSIVQQYMNADSFDPKKPLVNDKKGTILNPEGFKYHDFKNWIDNLETVETPIWAGLPASADDLLNISKLENLLTSLASVQDANDEEIVIDEKASGKEQGGKAKFMTELAERVKIYNDILPGSLTKLARNEQLISNPLFRFLEREVTVASNLLNTVHRVLKDVEDMAEGRVMPLQDTKKIAENIIINEVPKFWRKYIVPDHIGLANWIKDLKNRVEQLTVLSQTSDWQRKGVNLGEILFPEAFITATRQYVAQTKSVSMDELQLKISFSDTDNVDESSFLVKNIWIEGVNWTKNGLELSDEMTNHLKNVKFTWEYCSAAEIKKVNEGEIMIPLYLNSTRKNLILSLKFDIRSSAVSEKQLYQRGIALIAWKI